MNQPASTSDVREDLRTRYEEDGFIVVRGLFSAERMEQAAAEADCLLAS